MQDQDFTKLRSQINYTNSERSIRKLPEYQEILLKLQPGGKVELYKNDELDVNLTSNFGDKKTRQIKAPVSIDGCNHVILDLYDIFFYKEKAKCRNCLKEATKKNIKKDEFYTRMIQCMSEKSFSCSILGQQFYHSFSKDIQPIARQLLMKPEYKQLYLGVAESSKSKTQIQNMKAILLEQINQKQKELKQHNCMHINQIVEFPFQCLINCQKIIIPIYLNECKHLDCYEFTNILKLIEDNNALPDIYQKTSVKCYYQDCKTQIHLDINKLKQQLILPYDLASAISKNYPFSMKLVWDFQKSGFEYSKIKIQDFLKNDTLKQMLEKEKTQDYQLLNLFKKIINKEINSQLQNRLNFSKYKVNLGEIQFPCRCIYCELQNVKDIEEFICEYIYSNSQTKSQFTCPACNYIHQKCNKLEQIVYFDRYLYNAQLKTHDPQQFEYNKQDDKFQKFFQYHQTIDFKQVKIDYQKDKIYPYSNQFCTLKKKKVKSPLRLIFCKEKRIVELKSLKRFLEKNNFSFATFPNCNCYFCKAKASLEITDFYYDPVFYNILSSNEDVNFFDYIKKQLLNQYFENTIITDEIPQIGKIIQKYNEYKRQQEEEQSKQQLLQQQQQQQQQQYLISQQQQQLEQINQLQQYSQMIAQQLIQYQQPQPQQQQLLQPQYQYQPPPYSQNYQQKLAQETPQPQQQSQQFVFENGQLIPWQLYQMRQQ